MRYNLRLIFSSYLHEKNYHLGTIQREFSPRYVLKISSNRLYASNYSKIS